MEKYLPFINREQCSKIWLRDIMYIKQDGRFLKVVTDKGSYISYDRLEDIEQYIDDRFFHCLKKVIINFQQVSSMKDHVITFKNGCEIVLGRQNFVRTRQAFAIYIKRPCNFKGFVV